MLWGKGLTGQERGRCIKNAKNYVGVPGERPHQCNFRATHSVYLFFTLTYLQCYVTSVVGSKYAEVSVYATLLVFVSNRHSVRSVIMQIQSRKRKHFVNAFVLLMVLRSI